MNCILYCLIPDFWLEQSVHWETHLGLVGLKRLLAKNNPNQRNEPSKVTPHLTKRKIGVAMNWVSFIHKKLTATLSGTLIILTSTSMLQVQKPNFLFGILNIGIKYCVSLVQKTLYICAPCKNNTWYPMQVFTTGVPSWDCYQSLQCGREAHCTISPFFSLLGGLFPLPSCMTATTKIKGCIHMWFKYNTSWSWRKKRKNMNAGQAESMHLIINM